MSGEEDKEQQPDDASVASAVEPSANTNKRAYRIQPDNGPDYHPLEAPIVSLSSEDVVYAVYISPRVFPTNAVSFRDIDVSTSPGRATMAQVAVISHLAWEMQKQAVKLGLVNGIGKQWVPILIHEFCVDNDQSVKDVTLRQQKGQRLILRYREFKREDQEAIAEQLRSNPRTTNEDITKWMSEFDRHNSGHRALCIMKRWWEACQAEKDRIASEEAKGNGGRRHPRQSGGGCKLPADLIAYRNTPLFKYCSDQDTYWEHFCRYAGIIDPKHDRAFYTANLDSNHGGDNSAWPLHFSPAACLQRNATIDENQMDILNYTLAMDDANKENVRHKDPSAAFRRFPYPELAYRVTPECYRPDMLCEYMWPNKKHDPSMDPDVQSQSSILGDFHPDLKAAQLERYFLAQRRLGRARKKPNLNDPQIVDQVYREVGQQIVAQTQSVFIGEAGNKPFREIGKECKQQASRDTMSIERLRRATLDEDECQKVKLRLRTARKRRAFEQLMKTFKDPTGPKSPKATIIFEWLQRQVEAEKNLRIDSSKDGGQALPPTNCFRFARRKVYRDSNSIFTEDMLRESLDADTVHRVCGNFQALAFLILGYTRSYAESDTRLHGMFYGPGQSGKSFLVKLLAWLAIDGTVTILSYRTSKAEAIQGERTDEIEIYEETSTDILGAAGMRNGKPSDRCDNQAAEMLKQRMTSDRITVKSFLFDPMNGERKTRMFVCYTSSTIYFLSNIGNLPQAVPPALRTRATFWAFLDQIDRVQNPLTGISGILEKMSTPDPNPAFEQYKELTTEMFRRDQAMIFFVHKLIIAGAVDGVNVQCAEMIVTKVLAVAQRMGMPDVLQPRNKDRIIQLASELAIKDAVHKFFDRETSPYRDQAWQWEWILDIEPFLRVEVEHVVFACTLLAHQYEPPELYYLIRDLQSFLWGRVYDKDHAESKEFFEQNCNAEFTLREKIGQDRARTVILKSVKAQRLATTGTGRQQTVLLYDSKSAQDPNQPTLSSFALHEEQKNSDGEALAVDETQVAHGTDQQRVIEALALTMYKRHAKDWTASLETIKNLLYSLFDTRNGVEVESDHVALRNQPRMSIVKNLTKDAPKTHDGTWTITMAMPVITNNHQSRMLEALREVLENDSCSKLAMVTGQVLNSSSWAWQLLRLNRNDKKGLEVRNSNYISKARKDFLALSDGNKENKVDWANIGDATQTTTIEGDLDDHFFQKCKNDFSPELLKRLGPITPAQFRAAERTTGMPSINDYLKMADAGDDREGAGTLRRAVSAPAQAQATVASQDRIAKQRKLEARTKNRAVLVPRVRDEQNLPF